MSEAGAIFDAYLAAVPASYRARVDPEGGARALLSALREANARWPAVTIDEEDYARALAALTDADGQLPPFACDVYLALACARGDASALAAFESTFMPEVTRAVERIVESAAVAAEIAQEVRAKLFLATEDGPPKITEFAGRGPLGGWVRVVAARAALSHRRRANPARPGLFDRDEGVEALTPASSPELGYMRAQYVADFERALHEAFAALTSRERTLLRLNVNDGLNIEQIGAIYGVHRATVARWIARARERVEQETRRLLSERLGLTDSEFTSMMGLLASRVEVSLHSLLRSHSEVLDLTPSPEEEDGRAG